MNLAEDAHVDPRLAPAVTQVLVALNAQHGSNAVPLEAVNDTMAALFPAIVTLLPDVSLDDAEAVRKRVLAEIIVVAPEPPEGLTAPGFEPWLNDAVSEGDVTLKRWYNYKAFLAVQGFSPQVIDAMDAATQEIVDLLGDPRATGDWRRRGLVIGDVQSGKTATYVGILNKAADAGFKLVVLLAGGTESLRKQTQFRIDQGLIGRDSSVSKQSPAIGVGKYRIDGIPVLAQSLTSHAHDFNKVAANSGTQMIDPNDPVPMIFVIKKNKTALENVITWLDGQEHRDVPLLVVDDESDYASINTKYGKTVITKDGNEDESDPTLINRLIRKLLGSNRRSSYMAFTATPFANVFIDHETFDDALKDDLFPHDYIRALSSPSNYMGAAEYFGSSDEPDDARLVYIEDAETRIPLKHKSTLVVDGIPDSLSSAIRAFVVASAIRELAGDTSPRSMLVNVSRFKRVQEQVFEVVLAEVASVRAAIELHSGGASTVDESHPELIALHSQFENHFSGLGIEWADVRQKLIAGMLDTSVQLVNSDRKMDPELATKHVISVGGNVLSRGLTLEGLTVSYFHRVVGAADTLMQMARWFGYRPGYRDVVRVWIGSETADHFRYVSDVVFELRGQLREMKNSGKTPRDFGLAVRKHPETLRITAANKQGSAEMERRTISLAGRRIETTKLPSSPDVLSRNLERTLAFLGRLKQPTGRSAWNVDGMSHAGVEGVSRSEVAALLEGFGFEKTDRLLGGSTLSNTIRGSGRDAFNNWTVGIVQGSGLPVALPPLPTSLKANRLSVKVGNSSKPPTYNVSGRSARLAGSSDLGNTFADGSGLLEVMKPKTSQKNVYELLPNPTLLLYFIEPNLKVNPSPARGVTDEMARLHTVRAEEEWATAKAAGVTHLVALKVAIPGAPGSDGADVEYLVNGPWWERLADDEDLDDIDMEDIDE